MTIELELKRIADRLEMIHNHLVKLPEADSKLDKRLEKEEESDEAPAKRKPGRPAKGDGPKLGEEDVRKVALQVVKKHPDYGDEKNVKPGRTEVKRILKSLGKETIEDLEQHQYTEAIAAFERVIGTYVDDAEESDDLE